MTPAVPLLIVLSAPSGGGKTTLCDQLLAQRTDICRAVTCTTRPPRPGEQEGVHYHFLKRSEFEAQVEEGRFLEHATVYNHLYGTWKSEVIDKLHTSRHVLLNIDVQGARSIRAAASADSYLEPRLVSVFLTPPSLEDLERRLTHRASETPETLGRRLREASSEIQQWVHFDYLLISTTIAEDLRRMETILEAELMRRARSSPPLA